MNRTGSVSRATRETKVDVRVDLDGRGSTEVSTGIGMFDHLVTSLGHHAMIDLVATAEGDLHVDDHHTVEDTMLALGEAIDVALGDRSGITRFGDATVPMDEALAQCAVDFGGRSYLVADVVFRADRMGTMSTQMIEHALEAFTRTARCTMHVEATGRNDHHVAEATFKALALAIRSAVAIDERRSGVPSTKGTL